MDTDMVILVDGEDNEIGSAAKLQAHVEGLRHRAVSVLVVNSAGEMLLQRRQSGKYHSGGLWTNTCCSHPRPGEAPALAASRRLQEEMGFSTPLEPMFVAQYRARVGELIEDEIVHVFGGRHDGAVLPDQSEVDDYRWSSLDRLKRDIAADPARYTVWFVKYVGEFCEHLGALIARHSKRD